MQTQKEGHMGRRAGGRPQEGSGACVGVWLCVAAVSQAAHRAPRRRCAPSSLLPCALVCLPQLCQVQDARLPQDAEVRLMAQQPQQDEVCGGGAPGNRRWRRGRQLIDRRMLLGHAPNHEAYKKTPTQVQKMSVCLAFAQLHGRWGRAASHPPASWPKMQWRVFGL